jgi:hypothetical protein
MNIDKWRDELVEIIHDFVHDYKKDSEDNPDMYPIDKSKEDFDESLFDYIEGTSG